MICWRSQSCCLAVFLGFVQRLVGVFEKRSGAVNGEIACGGNPVADGNWNRYLYYLQGVAPEMALDAFHKKPGAVDVGFRKDHYKLVPCVA